MADRLGVDDVLRLGYRPHVTLAVFPDETPIPPIESALRRLAADAPGLAVTLAGLAIFPGTPPVLWAAPAPSARLLAFHRHLLEAIPFEPHPHYREDHWVPHVTLSKEAHVPAGALLDAVVSAWSGPIGGYLDRLELVRFRPVGILFSQRLEA
ncbi:MAG TPA: 2'-5' RNA ligase family protein [Rhodopila sp.]|nr:2'-5' RNA ligase family protein [Rhodopila sp.]